jgi:enoyl-CoA hydratase/carnithine racemase
VGRSIASRYVLTGEFFNAQQAKTWGVVSEVYKVEDLKKEALEVAKKVADMSMYTAIAAKDAVKQANELGISEGLKFERRVFQGLINTKAVKEGVDAFLKKRKANFNNI